MVPNSFEGPVSTWPERLLPHNLTEEHAARPTPDFLATGCIEYNEIVCLARLEAERHQFFGTVDDCEHKLRAARNFRRLYIESDSFFRWLDDVIHLAFVLRFLLFWWGWGQCRSALGRGFRRFTFTHVYACKFCNPYILTRVHPRLDDPHTALESQIDQIAAKNELHRQTGVVGL